MSSNKSIFKIIEQKIYNSINNQLKKVIKPNITLKKVADIDLYLIKKLKTEYGIGGIIVDVDETLRKDMMQIPDCNKQWIEFMKSEFKVIILSNGYDGKVKKFANDRGIDYMSFAKKPLSKGMKTACAKMGLEPENVLVIGDDIVTDIYGGNRCGMLTAIVEDVDYEIDK